MKSALNVVVMAFCPVLDDIPSVLHCVSDIDLTEQRMRRKFSQRMMTTMMPKKRHSIERQCKETFCVRFCQVRSIWSMAGSAVE